MLKKEKYIVIFALTILPGLGFGFSTLVAQQKPSLVLFSARQAVDSAMKNNPLIAEKKLKLESLALERKSGYFEDPLEVDYSRGNRYAPGIENNFRAQQNFGSIPAHVSRSKVVDHQLVAGEQLLELTRNQIAREVKKAYYQWAFQYHLLNLLEEKLELYEDYKRVAKLHYQKGETSKLDMVVSLSRFDAVEMDYKIAMDDLLIAENNLRMHCHVNEDIFPAEEELELYFIEYQKENPKLTSKTILDFYQSKLAEKNAMVKYQQSMYFPALRVGYFYQDFAHQNSFHGVTVGLDIPLFYFHNKSKVEQAKLDFKMQTLHYQYQKTKVENQIANKVLELDKFFWQIEYYNNSALEQAETILSTSKLQYGKEDISYFKYVDMVDRAIKIKREYLETINKYNQSAIELEYLTK